MKISIIGAGNMGLILARKFVEVGHEVKVSNSREPETIKEYAQAIGFKPVVINDIVKNADVIVIAIPVKNIPLLPENLFQNAPHSAVVIDVGNYYPVRDGIIKEIHDGLPESVWTSDIIKRSVVKVFNTISPLSIQELANKSEKIAIPVSGDNERDKEVIKGLLDDIGFDFFDVGTLADSWKQQPGAPIYATNLKHSENKNWVNRATKSSLPARRENFLKLITGLPTNLSLSEQTERIRNYLLSDEIN